MHDRSTVIKLLLLGLIAVLLLLLPVLVADAANDIASSYQVNNTAVELTATWTEYAIISGFATGVGNTTVTITVNTATNISTARSYGRIKRDGVVIESFNLSQSFYPETITYIAPMAETEATHNYSFESYCTAGKKCTLYNRTFSAIFIKTGSFAASVTNVTATSPVTSTYGATPNIACPTCVTNTTAQITRTQVTGQESVDTGQNTSITNIESVNVNQNTSISALQANDTYFNGTVYPNSTNFRNDSALQTSTYNGNFPNNTVASKEATWDAKSVFMNLSVWGQSALTSFVRFVAGSGVTFTQSGTNITIGDGGTNSTLTTHTAATGTTVHGLGNVSLLNTPLNDSVLENGSVFVKTSNTSYVLTSNSSYVLTNNASHVLTNNGSYVLTSNTSYVKTDNTSYVLVTNTSLVLTSNSSYVLVTNTTYVLTNNASYVLTSNTSHVLTNNASYALTSNLTYPRTSVSNGSSLNLTYNSSTGVFNLNLPACGSGQVLNSTGGNFTCQADSTSAFSFIVTGGETHTGSMTATAGTGITFTDSGGVWTISSPAAGVTNASVSPYNMNGNNITSGTVDFYSRVDNVSINLTTGSSSNVSGLLPDANLASTFVKTVGATSPCTSTGGQNPSITCTGMDNATVNFYSGNASNLTTGVLPNASIPKSALNMSSSVGLTRIYNSTNQLNLATGVETLINLNTASYGTECTASVCTVTENGTYHIDGVITWTATVASANYQTHVYINGASAIQVRDATSVVGELTLGIHTDYKLVAGDTISLYGRSGDGVSTTDVLGGSGFTYLSYHVVRRI